MSNVKVSFYARRGRVKTLEKNEAGSWGLIGVGSSFLPIFCTKQAWDALSAIQTLSIDIDKRKPYNRGSFSDKQFNEGD